MTEAQGGSQEQAMAPLLNMLVVLHVIQGHYKVTQWEDAEDT
jgi:hypothetical protein